MVSRSLSTSQKFAGLNVTAEALAEFCQLLYLMMIPHTDDFGRLQGDPFTIKHQCLPASSRSTEEFQAALNHLHQAQLITWYQVSGKQFVQITNFDPHQVGLHKRTYSQFPEIPGNSRKRREIPSEEKRTELKGKEKNGSSTASVEPTLTVLEFPVVGAQGPVWGLSETLVAEWRALFPNVDVLAEARKALAWLRANEGRRKTANGMPRFLVRWLTRAVDDRRPVGVSTRPLAASVPDAEQSQALLRRMRGES